MSERLSEHKPWFDSKLSDQDNSFRITVLISIALVFIISGLDIAGWIFNISLFKSVIPAWEPMRIITAVCCVCSALAVSFIYMNSGLFTGRVIPLFFATFVLIVSILTIGVHVYLFSGGQEHKIPLADLSFLLAGGRMAFLTSCSFFLLGCILILYVWNKQFTSEIAHVLIIPYFFISYFTIVSYMLGVYTATRLNDTPVALNTAITFCCLFLAVLFMKPATWIMKLYIYRDTAGLISRRLLTPAMVLPVVIGWFRIHGERAGLFGSDEGVVIVAMIYTLCFLILLWMTALTVRRIDRKRQVSDRVLRESEERFRTLADNVPDQIARFDKDLRLIYANPAVINRTGLSPGNLPGFTAREYGATESSLKNWEKAARTVLSTGKPVRFEDTDEWQNTKRFLDVQLVPEFNTDEELSSIIAISHDITERKLSEEALRESEERFRTIAETVPALVCVTRIEDSIVLFTNEVNNKAFGLAGEKILGTKGPEYYCNPEDRQKMIEIFKEQGVINNFQVKVKKSDGTPFWIMTSVRPIIFHGQPAMIGASIDITDYRKVEEALLESEARFRNLIKFAPAVIYEMDLQGNSFISVNDTMCKLLGYSRAELLKIRPADLLDEKSQLHFRDRVRRRLEGENIEEDIEYRVKRKDGTWIDALITVGNISTRDESVSGFTVIAYDITERKRIELALRESERRFRELIKNAPTAIYELNFKDRKFTSVNDAMCRMSGYSREELLSLDANDLLVGESKALFISRLNRNLKGEKAEETVEYNVKAKDGHIIEAILNMKFNYNEQGIPVGAMVVGHDITERKRVERELRGSEEALKESEGKLWSVLNATRESIFMFDKKGRFTMANSTGLQRLNDKTEKELIGHHFSEFMPNSIAAYRQIKLDEVFNSGKPLEFEDERDGRLFNHNYFPVFKDDKVSFVVTYSTDITERKKAESNLKESEDRFRTIAESLPVLISIYNIKDSAISFVNESYEKTFGLKKDELLNRRVPDSFFYQKDRTELGKLLQEKGKVYNKEIRVKKKDGTPFWIMTSIRKISFMNESAYLTASINITETKDAQDELLRLNRTLNALSKSSQAMMRCENEFNYLNEVCKIIIEDCGHSMVWVGYAQNDSVKSVKPVAYFGFDKGYIDQLNITWSDNERGRGPTGTAIRTGKPSLCKNMLTDPAFEPWRKAALERGYSSSLVLPLVLDGKPFGAISIYSKEPDPFSKNEINLLSNLAVDMAYGISYIRLTESERASAKAIKESEAKLKELVATKDKFFNIVAHDLKNPFTSLLGSSELLFNNINQMTSENVRELALILNDSAKGGYAILQNLLDWSRSQTGLLKFNLEKVNLKTIIDENIENLQLQVNNKGINIKSGLTKDLHVMSDKNMINTILRNLLSNAVKYTHKNGTVVVRISKTPKNVIVTVKDSGIGIPKEKVATLFRIDNSMSTPGTAKEQGTGLGLKLCKEFTERMGGRIWVDSAEGKGSEFKFSIPQNSMEA